MYAVANVEKFLSDNKGKISHQKAAAILKRARKQGEPDGVLMAGMSKDLWRDAKLETQFGQVLTNDVEHIEMSFRAIRARKH